MFHCYVGDQLLDQHCLSYSGAAKKSDFSSFCIRSKKVNHLDSCFQHFNYVTLVFKGWRISVNNPLFLFFQTFSAVNCFTQNIKEPSQCFLSYRHTDPSSGRLNLHILIQTLAGSQHYAADYISANMLSHLHYTAFSFVVCHKGILNMGKSAILKCHIYYRSHNLHDLSFIHGSSYRFFLCDLAPPITSVIS